MYAFFNCNSLTVLKFGNSITSIGYGSFSLCFSLTSITIPDSVTSISEYAFLGCSGLTSIIFPESVTTIGAHAFEGCSGLTTVTIPNSVTFIGDNAFAYCTNLTTVNCEIEIPLVLNENVFDNVNQSICTLNVLDCSVDLYKSEIVWKNFNPIQGNGSCLLTSNSFINKSNVILYPNPVQNKLFLELNNSDNANLEVLDLNGKVLLIKYLKNTINSIDTSDFSNGMYLFKVTSNNKTITKKVIKD